MRLYDTSKCGCEEIFWCEMGVFFEYMVNQNLKIYYVKSSPKHNTFYTEECFNFFKNYRSTHVYNDMPDNLKKLRELQLNDLMYFYENLILESFHIISKIKNNKYYYDMVIITKPDFIINDFFKINFNTINIESISPIFFENITYDYMKKLFNFEELDSYAFCNFLDQSYIDMIYDPKHKETQEYKNLEKYKQEQFELGNFNKIQSDNSLYWYYRNEYNGIVSEMMDHKLMFNNYFSNFGWQWYILNYNFNDSHAVEARNYTYPINETFLLTLDNILTPIAIVNSEMKIEEYTQPYKIGCMFDLLENLNECNNYSLNSFDVSVPKIVYNTSYKCRLNKTKKHE